mmetsp:Transcript_37911/g.61149  ORF Transcript_37911/g.61149 Transcript_37911/m.61149 type:complete len:350 (-) Transcript_37911:285-1334(-)
MYILSKEAEGHGDSRIKVCAAVHQCAVEQMEKLVHLAAFSVTWPSLNRRIISAVKKRAEVCSRLRQRPVFKCHVKLTIAVEARGASQVDTSQLLVVALPFDDGSALGAEVAVQNRWPNEIIFQQESSLVKDERCEQNEFARFLRKSLNDEAKVRPQTLFHKKFAPRVTERIIHRKCPKTSIKTEAKLLVSLGVVQVHLCQQYPQRSLSIRFVERIRIEIEKFLNHVAAPIGQISNTQCLGTHHSAKSKGLLRRRFTFKSNRSWPMSIDLEQIRGLFTLDFEALVDSAGFGQFACLGRQPSSQFAKRTEEREVAESSHFALIDFLPVSLLHACDESPAPPTARRRAGTCR